MCVKRGRKGDTERTGGEAKGEQRASGRRGEEGAVEGLPAAELQSPCCHLHYLTFNPTQTQSSYYCPSVLYV